MFLHAHDSALRLMCPIAPRNLLLLWRIRLWTDTMTWPTASPFLQNISLPLFLDALPTPPSMLPYVHLTHQDALAVSIGVGLVSLRPT